MITGFDCFLGTVLILIINHRPFYDFRIEEKESSAPVQSITNQKESNLGEERPFQNGKDTFIMF